MRLIRWLLVPLAVPIGYVAATFVVGVLYVLNDFLQGVSKVSPSPWGEMLIPDWEYLMANGTLTGVFISTLAGRIAPTHEKRVAGFVGGLTTLWVAWRGMSTDYGSSEHRMLTFIAIGAGVALGTYKTPTLTPAPPPPRSSTPTP